jgi:hypothetical protein
MLKLFYPVLGSDIVIYELRVCGTSNRSSIGIPTARHVLFAESVQNVRHVSLPSSEMVVTFDDTVNESLDLRIGRFWLGRYFCRRS